MKKHFSLKRLLIMSLMLVTTMLVPICAWAQEYPETHKIRYTASERLSGYDEWNHTPCGMVDSHEFNDGSGCITFFAPVTSIGDDAFSWCDNLTSITIPEGVSSIGIHAFYVCENLTSITLPASVTSIGDGAFSGCENLTSITLPASVTSIGEGAFTYCGSLTSITIPEGVISIGDGAFERCRSLASITLPASMTSMGGGLFVFCDNLSSIVVSDGNPTYDSRNGCNAIIETSTNTLLMGCKNSTIPEGVSSIGDGAFIGCSLASITLPASVTSIGNYAFSWCGSLTSITIPEGLTSIGEEAFSGCGSLTSITIPASVTSMGEKAFGGCNSIKDIYVNWDTPISIADNVFPDVVYSNATLHVKDDNFALYRETAGWSKFKSIEDKSDFCFYYTSSAKLTIYDEGQDTPCGTVVSHEFSDGKGCITFAEPVTSIGENAFFWCISLTSITIPSTVTSIGSYAFYWCENLTGITLPEGLTSIGDHAFAGSSSQTSITLPSTVTSIGDGAFYFCGSLTSITIPASVTNFGERVFSTCNNLQSVIFSGFNGEENDLVLKCDVSVDTYSAEALTIDDSKPLQIPVDFTAESVAYSREVTAGKPCTFMLPYAVTGEQLGGTIYKLSGYEDDKVKFAQVEGETKPNVPYMIVPTGNALQGSVTNDNVQIQKTAGKAFVSGSFAGLQMVGSYSKQQLTVSPGLDFYGFYQGSFVKAGVSANLNPYRAMLQLAGTSGSAPSRLSMILDEEATSVTTLDEEMDKSTLPLYDLYGRQISAPSTRGIYINPQSGKKIRTL